MDTQVGDTGMDETLVRNLVSALEAVEWVYDDGSGASFCENCNRSREDGHNKLCAVGNVLEQARK